MRRTSKLPVVSMMAAVELGMVRRVVTRRERVS